MTIKIRFLIDRGEFKLDVDFSIPSQKITGLFGTSGCGKTTLLRAIAGLEQHPHGFLRVGKEIWQDETNFVPPFQRPLGYIFQEASLFQHLTVQGNLEYGWKRIPHFQRQISLDEAIELLGIRHLLKRKPHKLSGGERQRVAIARSLVVSPKLLLMDEPLASLDLISKQEILPYLDSIQNQLDIPIIYVSHSLDEITRLADHLILLESGCVVATGAINEMLTRLDLPLAHADDAESVIEAIVDEYDHKYHLTYLDSVVGRFTLIGRELSLGKTVRLRIAARDVSLTLKPQTQTSILNIFPVTVDKIIVEAKTYVTVRLQAGGIFILARISSKSASILGLKSGKLVYAQVKSVALLS